MARDSTYVCEDELYEVQRQLLCVRSVGVRARRRREPAVDGRSDGSLSPAEFVGDERSSGSRVRGRAAGSFRRAAGHG